MIEKSQSRKKIKTPFLVAVVVGLHGLAVGAFLFIQGCGTTPKTTTIGPPPSPMMPPKETTVEPITPKPVLQPPVAVEPAPSIVEPSASSTYTVSKGDTLSSIAYRFGVSSREIAELNNIKDANKIKLGQKLLLPNYARTEPIAAPKKSTSTKSADKPASVARSSSEAASAGGYVVKAGDSLSKIASRQGTTVKALREANNLKSDMIRIGQKLVIPGSAALTTEPAAPSPVTEPMAITSPETAAPASETTEPAPATVEPTTGSTSVVEPQLIPADMPFEYTVQAGETLDDVARKFAVLKQDVLTLNGITGEAAVQAGQKIKIPLSTP